MLNFYLELSITNNGVLIIKDNSLLGRTTTMKMMMIITMPGTRIKVPIVIREMCHPSRCGDVQAIETRNSEIKILLKSLPYWYQDLCNVHLILFRYQRVHGHKWYATSNWYEVILQEFATYIRGYYCTYILCVLGWGRWGQTNDRSFKST